MEAPSLNPEGARDFSPLRTVQIGSAAHPGGFSASVKWPLLGADYKLPFRAELKNNVNPLRIKNNVNPLKTKRRPLYLKTQSVPRCKHFSSRL